MDTESPARSRAWVWLAATLEAIAVPIAAPNCVLVFSDAVATFLRTVAFAPGARWRVLPVGANGQLAFGEYRWNETTERFAARALMVLTIADTMIADITAFGSPELFPHFGLPEQLEP